MSWVVMFTQVFLPVLLLVWLALFPAAGWLAWGLQVVSVGGIWVGLWLTALWTMPPFWVPYVYGLVLVIIVIRHWARGAVMDQRLWQASAAQSVAIVLVCGLGLVAAYMGYQAIQGQRLPEGAVADIAAPFPPGHYLVAHGGATPMVNVHLKTLDESVERFRPWRGQSKALDIFRTSSLGLHKDGWQPADPAMYVTFGTAVLSPCRGEVAKVVDAHPDMTVPDMDRDTLPGNYVAIDCGDFFVILAHLRRGSISVAASEQVDVGDALGQMGNSGNSSEPHLHLHAQRRLPAHEPLSGEPLWLTVDGRFLTRNDRIHIE
ncbi:M23 family metallopeptidase [Halomonas salinarum]|uniref:M23 family metallopeptidase n=1 Tax=Halomonas salinarum TaxID=1158993 RepID=UPI001439434B|nr:M23 family metallopeptidase [Halomonas salinarum]